MNMQILLESPSIFTEVLKDQMDGIRAKHAAVAVATPNCPMKTKLKQRARQSGWRASDRGKRMRLGSDDERDSEDEGQQDPPKRTTSSPFLVGRQLTDEAGRSLNAQLCSETGYRHGALPISGVSTLSSAPARSGNTVFYDAQPRKDLSSTAITYTSSSARHSFDRLQWCCWSFPSVCRTTTRL